MNTRCWILIPTCICELSVSPLGTVKTSDTGRKHTAGRVGIVRKFVLWTTNLCIMDGAERYNPCLGQCLEVTARHSSNGALHVPRCCTSHWAPQNNPSKTWENLWENPRLLFARAHEVHCFRLLVTCNDTIEQNLRCTFTPFTTQRGRCSCPNQHSWGTGVAGCTVCCYNTTGRGHSQRTRSCFFGLWPQLLCCFIRASS